MEERHSNAFEQRNITAAFYLWETHPGLWVPKCVQSCLGEVRGEIICSVFITRRETAVKQILISHFVLGLLTLIPPPRFCLVRAVNSTKWCKAMPASEGSGIAQKTFPTSITCHASSTRKTPTRFVLLFISNKQPEPRQPDEDDIWLSNLCQVTAVL